MKYKVIGWTNYDDDMAEGEASDACINAIVDCIKENNYCFSGWDHQENLYCVPILNDGKKRTFSQRTFGYIMALAHECYGQYDYSIFAFGINENAKVLPKGGYYSWYSKPEVDLNEVFEVNIDNDTLSKVMLSNIIKLDDLDSLRYIDTNDTLIINNSISFKIKSVERKKDLTDDEMIQIRIDESYYGTKRAELAKKKFNEAKIVIYISLERM